MDDKTNLTRKIVASLVGAVVLLASVVAGLHYEGREFLQGSLLTVRADIKTIKGKAQDCEADRKELRIELTDLTKKVSRQQGFIEGQKVIATGKPKSSVSKN
jgi:hypothetical protein